MKNYVTKLSVILVMMLVVFGFAGSASYATSITIEGGTEPVVLTETVDTIEIKSTIGQLVDILNAYKVNTGYNFAQYASNATINAKITDMFSTDNITMLSTVAPECAKVKINPEVKDIVYNLPFTMPEDFEIDFTDTIVHLPEATTVADALKVFNEVGVAQIVSSGDNYNITKEGNSKLTTIHLNKGQSLKDIFDLINDEGLDEVLVAVPDYHVNLIGAKDTIWLEGNLTEEEVLELVKDLKVNATVRLIESDKFTVELSIDKEPVVNKSENPEVNPPVEEEPKGEEVVENEKDETPKTGAMNIALYVCVAVALISLIGAVKLKISKN